MQTAFQHSALLSIVALAMVPMSAFADDKSSALFETKLDIDNDGRTDRAVLVLVGSDRTDVGPLTDELYAVGDGESVDLYLYLAVGDEELDLSRKPAVLKRKIVDPEETPWVQPLESKNSGSLVVTSCYGCGANKSWDQKLTIVYRGGEFVVAGYARDWDWNSHLADGSVETIMGGCEIDFLSGKGVVSEGLDEGKPIEGTFTPVKLADWSDARRPEACNF